jgi:hypothetical protein
MLVLLPLRGWAGTSMTIDMALQQVAAAAQSAPSLDDMPPDCPMLTGAADSTANAPSKEGTNPSCSGCDTCELCLAMAAFAAPAFQATAFSPNAAPAAVPQGFLSADDSSRLKPPIS